MIYIMSGLVIIIFFIVLIVWAAKSLLEGIIWLGWACYICIYKYFTLDIKMKKNPYNKIKIKKQQEMDENRIKLINERIQNKKRTEEEALFNYINNIKKLYPNADKKLFKYINDNFDEISMEEIKDLEKKIMKSNGINQQVNELMICENNKSYDINILKVNGKYKMEILDHSNSVEKILYHDNYDSLYKLFSIIKNEGIQFIYKYRDLHLVLRTIDNVKK